jgi:hypothetical protein
MLSPVISLRIGVCEWSRILVNRKTINSYSEVDVYWSNHARTLNPQGGRLTTPKPDLTYGFPVYKSMGDLPKGAAHMDLFRNFSADTIRKLSRSPWELKSSLTTKIPQGDLEDLQNSDTMCFPWAVVEVKKCPRRQDVRHRCYRQAANASATALDITTRLFEEPGGHVSDDLPPIIAFTCVGPELRLWLTFWVTIDGRKVKVRIHKEVDTYRSAKHF